MVVADNTATGELTLWQDFINAVSLGKSYEMVNLMVKTFNDKTTLFTPRLNVQIKEIEDLKDVVPLAESIKRTKRLLDAKIIAVSDFKSGLWCISCNAGYVNPLQTSEDYGRCRLWQLMTYCLRLPSSHSRK